MTCCECYNQANNDSKTAMNNPLSISLMLLSPVNVLERVHIREFHIYDPLWRPYFISMSCSKRWSPSQHKLLLFQLATWWIFEVWGFLKPIPVTLVGYYGVLRSCQCNFRQSMEVCAKLPQQHHEALIEVAERVEAKHNQEAESFQADRTIEWTTPWKRGLFFSFTTILHQ